MLKTDAPMDRGIVPSVLSYWNFCPVKFTALCENAKHSILRMGSGSGGGGGQPKRMRMRDARVKTLRVEALEEWKEFVLAPNSMPQVQIAYRSGEFIQTIGIHAWEIMLKCGYDPTIHPPRFYDGLTVDYSTSMVSIATPGFCVYKYKEEVDEDSLCEIMTMILEKVKDFPYHPERGVCIDSALQQAIYSNRFKLSRVLIRYGASLMRIPEFNGSFHNYLMHGSGNRHYAMKFMVENGYKFKANGDEGLRLQQWLYPGGIDEDVFYCAILAETFDPNYVRFPPVQDGNHPPKMPSMPNMSYTSQFLHQSSGESHKEILIKLLFKGFFLNPISFPEQHRMITYRVLSAILGKEDDLILPVDIIISKVLSYM